MGAASGPATELRVPYSVNGNFSPLVSSGMSELYISACVRLIGFVLLIFLGILPGTKDYVHT